MAMFRGPDPLSELFERERAYVLSRLERVIAGEPNRALDGVAERLTVLAKVESEVLYPAFSKVTLRPEAQRQLEDAKDHRTAHLEALADLQKTRRGHPLRKLRALKLQNLLQHDAMLHGTLLLPVLRSQLSFPCYQALANAVRSRLAAHQAPTEAGPHTAPARPVRALRAS